MPELPAINKKGLSIALFFGFVITVAGVFLHGRVIPEAQDDSIVSTPETQEQDKTASETPTTSPDSDTESTASKPLPPELAAMKKKLEEGVPTKEQERSQAIMAETDALIQQTDALVAQAGQPAVSAETSSATAQDAPAESDLHTRIAELRDKATELKARQQSQ